MIPFSVLDRSLSRSAISSKETVKKQIHEFIQATQADELIITGQIFDHRARMRSHEIAAEVRDELASDLDH